MPAISFSARDPHGGHDGPTTLPDTDDRVDVDSELDLDLELERSIATMTLNHCPHAVKKTIVWSQRSRFAGHKDGS